MSRRHLAFTDRFSDYLADELGEAERGEVESHLAECGECRDVLAELDELLARAQALPDLEPPRDLWPGIVSAIGGRRPRAAARGKDSSVIELSPARVGDLGAPSEWEVPGRVGLRRAGLLVAAAALVAVSVGTTWWATTSWSTPSGPLQTAEVPLEDAVRATDTGAPPADLASQLATLEGVLEAARDALDANTVRILERNLGVIEQAIADSREALALDPGNAFLAEHLERMYRRKLLYLQDAVRVAQWSG